MIKFTARQVIKLWLYTMLIGLSHIVDGVLILVTFGLLEFEPKLHVMFGTKRAKFKHRAIVERAKLH